MQYPSRIVGSSHRRTYRDRPRRVGSRHLSPTGQITPYLCVRSHQRRAGDFSGGGRIRTVTPLKRHLQIKRRCSLRLGPWRDRRRLEGFRTIVLPDEWGIGPLVYEERRGGREGVGWEGRWRRGPSRGLWCMSTFYSPSDAPSTTGTSGARQRPGSTTSSTRGRSRRGPTPEGRGGTFWLRPGLHEQGGVGECVDGLLLEKVHGWGTGTQSIQSRYESQGSMSPVTRQGDPGVLNDIPFVVSLRPLPRTQGNGTPVIRSKVQERHRFTPGSGEGW